MKPGNAVAFFYVLFISLSSFALSPVGTHGRLKVEEGTIIGSTDNQPVQLAGMSLFWSLWEGGKYYNRKVVNWLVKDWNITVIRACLGIGQGAYEGDPSTSNPQYDMIKTVVDAAIANGIYVIVDFHAHDANLEVDAARKFFSDISKEYAGVPNIIWEIWNEPNTENGSGIVFPDSSGFPNPNNFDNWRDIKQYAAEIIPVIRANSDNLIVVGTPFWSQFVDTAAADPIDEPDIAYALHFYAAHPPHQDSLRMRARTAVEAGAALFITEFGTTIADGGSDGVVDSTQTAIWLDWADSNSISWVNWSIVDKGEASAAIVGGVSDTGGWSEDQLTESGRLIRNRLLSREPYDYSDIIPSDGKSLPGIIEAESFIAKSNDLRTDASGDGGGECLGYTSNGAWADYKVTVRKAGEYKARLRVASAEGGTVTLKTGEKSLASWTVAATGGWSSWKTTEYGTTFTLAEGDINLRAEWSGTASSLVNLNWMEFTFVGEADTTDIIDTIPTDTGSIIDVPDGRTLPGRIEAELLESKSKDLIIEATSDSTGEKNLGYTTDGAWAEYSVNVSKPGKYTSRYRVAADEGFGGTITMKFDDREVSSLDVGSTGGWSNWLMVDIPDTFELAGGETVLRVEWSGTASSLVNLNWMDFTYHPETISTPLLKPVSRSSFPTVTIANGILSLRCSDDAVRVELLSLDGRVLETVLSASRHYSLPIGKGVFVLALHGRDGSVRTRPVIHY
jgi:endoglucanase